MEEQAPSFWFIFQHEALPVLKAVGGNLLIWLVLASLFLLVLIYLHRRTDWGPWAKLASSIFMVSLLSLLTGVWHLWAFFGESFTTGVDPYRLPVMMSMNVLCALYFSVRSFRTPGVK